MFAGERLPDTCLACGRRTSQRIRLLFDDTGHHPDRFWLVTILVAVLALFVGWILLLTRRQRPTIDMDLPMCGGCQQSKGRPVAQHVDWSTHEVTLEADIGFKRALELLREKPNPPGRNSNAGRRREREKLWWSGPTGT